MQPDRYIRLAKEYGLLNAIVISPEDIYFDIRSILKCRWGCQQSAGESVRCQSRNTAYSERIEMIKRYRHILIVHSHDAVKLSTVLLKLERTAFFDGNYFAFAIFHCNLCGTCRIEKGESCPAPEKVRPCEGLFGIDVYKTARSLGLPCNVLQSKNDIENRYGFLLID